MRKWYGSDCIISWVHLLALYLLVARLWVFVGSKKVREMSRECHNHKSQPFPDPKKKRKPTNRTNVRKALRLALSSPSEVIAIVKGLKNTRTKWHTERHTTNHQFQCQVWHCEISLFCFSLFCGICAVSPASILRKSTSGRHRPVSYPDGPMTARYRFT